MPTRRGRKKAEPTTDRPDYGPEPRRARGELIIEHVGDPARPNTTITRARVTWTPDLWLARGTISQAEHDAALRLLTSYEIGILGAGNRKLGIISRPCHGPHHFTDARLAAAEDFRSAKEAVGRLLFDALTWCVLSTATVDDYARAKRWHRTKAAGVLLAAMVRLREHYERK